jgi:hypothetical protein
MKIRIVNTRTATQQAVRSNDNTLPADDLTIAHASIRPNLQAGSRSHINDASPAATHWVPITPRVDKHAIANPHTAIRMDHEMHRPRRTDTTAEADTVVMELDPDNGRPPSEPTKTSDPSRQFYY